MSFYSDASLVMIPSGYKDQKVYCAVPTDGLGDLTFSRASSATRVQSDGLIEKVRTNLFLQSQTFDNASWNKDSCVVTANATTAPDGTLTAEKLVINNGIGPSDGFDTGLLQTGSVNTGTYTYSVFAKASEFTGLRFRERISIGDFIEFNLSTGVAPAGSSTFINPTMVNVGNGWYRCSFVTQSNTANTNKYALRVGGTGDGTSGIFIWGAQLEATDFGATPYIATTTAAVSVGPVSGLPRLDYLGSTCPRLLLEPQRSNLVTYSEQLDNAAWTKLDTAVTANAGTSPDGYTNADKIVPNTTSTRHILYQAKSASVVQTFSVFAKAAGQNFLTMRLDDDTPEVNVYFNLSTGTIGSTDGGSPTMTSYGNGWYRCTMTYTPSGTETIYAVVGSANQNGVQAYAGNNTDGILVYGAQLEAGAYATSYIPTLGASVTRVADAASKTGISSLIGQTEGTLFADVDLALNGDAAGILGVFGTGTTFVYLFTAVTTNILNANIYISAVEQASMNYTLPSAGRYKIAVGYKANDFVLYVNGVQRGSDNSGSVPACTDLRIDEVPTYSINANSKHNQALLFKTRLTNAQCQELTSL
jgi:hypothetical protein